MFATQVEMVEALGADNLAHVSCHAQHFVARLPHHVHPQVGEALYLRPQTGRWYAFDTASGARVPFA